MIGAVLIGIGLAALAGLGAASALVGRGWVWPHGAPTIGHVLGGVLTGHPTRGLSVAQRRLVAAPAALYTGIAAAEVTLMALVGAVAALIARYRHPNDARSGMATRAEAKQVLGVRALHAARQILRPDRRAPDRRAPDRRAPDRRAPDRRAPDRRAPDRRAADRRAPEPGGPDRHP